MTNLERYHFYCDALETCALYEEFSFYSLIGACLQRRYWTSSDSWPLYPNNYFIFVGLPGTGKTVAARGMLNVLNKINAAWNVKPWFKSSPKSLSNSSSTLIEEIIHIAPDTVTVEQLIKRMGVMVSGYMNKDIVEYQSALTFVSEELGNLFRFNDTYIIEFFKAAWDCANKYTRETKGQGCDSISKPCVNLIAGTTPSWIASGMQYGIINEGFLGRGIFIHGGTPIRKRAIFKPTPEQENALDFVYQHCKSIVNQEGGYVPLSKESEAYFIDWHNTRNVPKNPDSILLNYYARKKALVLKLAMIIHFSNYTETRVIDIVDIDQALAALERAEVNMHLALSSAGRNPLHKLADDIYLTLKTRNKSYSTELLAVKHHRNGDLDEVGKALQYLLMSKKVLYYPTPDGWMYKVNTDYKEDSII